MSTHTKPRRVMALALIAGSLVLISGCYEDIGMTRYEAGVYKGSDDPLRAKLESGELQDQLAERFELAARDR